MKRRDYLAFAPRLFFKRDALPLYLVFFVTERCPAACRHCLLGGRNPIENELTLDEIEKVSASLGPILFLLLTGGDPFVRSDFAEIATVFHRQNRALNLGVPTNGSQTEGVVGSVQRILAACPEMDVAVDVSIDGIGAEHDEIRQLPGLFEKAVWTYRELAALARREPRFQVNVAVTVSACNQDRLTDLYRWLRDQLQVRTVNQLLVRGRPREPGAGLVDIEKYLAFSRLLADEARAGRLQGYHDFPGAGLVNAMKHVRQEAIARIARERRSFVPCYAANLAGVLAADGQVLPCELRPERLGNVREVGYDFGAIWRSPRTRQLARRIRRERCFCTYECFLTCGVLFTPSLAPRVLREAWRLRAAGGGQPAPRAGQEEEGRGC